MRLHGGKDLRKRYLLSLVMKIENNIRVAESDGGDDETDEIREWVEQSEKKNDQD